MLSDDEIIENYSFHKKSSCEIFPDIDMSEILNFEEDYYLHKYFETYEPEKFFLIIDSNASGFELLRKYDEQLKIKYKIPEIPKIYFLKKFPNIIASISLLCLFHEDFKKNIVIPPYTYSIYSFIMYQLNIYEIIEILYQLKDVKINLFEKQMSIFKILYDYGKNILPIINWYIPHYQQKQVNIINQLLILFKNIKKIEKINN